MSGFNISGVKDILLKYSHVEDLPKFISDNFDNFDAAERHLLSGHFDLQTRLSKDLLLVLDAHPLIDEIRNLLEEDNPKLHVPPVARWVLPYSKLAAVPPHQDISYNPSFGSFVVAWIPFTTISNVCGGVKVFPKNGRNEALPTQTEDFWLSPVPTSGGGIHCKIGLGDVLLLDPYIVHTSMPNVSEDVRLSVDYRFYKSGATSGKHFMRINDRVIVAPQKGG
ncbi:phytanoyl-CoA dioxygenase family protein [bacterium]|nr:phytanoyl-CoA dioxygenase family protein [bacterium]